MGDHICFSQTQWLPLHHVTVYICVNDIKAWQVFSFKKSRLFTGI